MLQCAHCSVEIPDYLVGTLDYLSETCSSGCDGEGRFDVRCPSCGGIVATFDLPLGYSARELAEKLSLPMYSAMDTEVWPDSFTPLPSTDLSEYDFEVEYEGQRVTATVLRVNPTGSGRVFGPYPCDVPPAVRTRLRRVMEAYCRLDDEVASMGDDSEATSKTLAAYEATRLYVAGLFASPAGAGEGE